MIERYFISAIFGGIVTVALMYLMQSLIFSDTPPPMDESATAVIVITRVIEDTPPVDPLPPRPTLEDQPPPPPPMTVPDGDPDPITIEVPTLPPVETPRPGQIVRQLTPMVRVPPEYPRGALNSGIEGFAIVAFEVNTEGRTQNATIVSSEPGSIFDRAALNSIAGWRYQAQTDDDGNPVTVGGQRFRFDFVMNRGEE